jgi:hypothetical protein
MDETAFRQRLAELHERACPFAKSILTRCAGCSKSLKRNIAEREIVVCASAEAHARCIELRDLLRHNFTFALGKLNIDGPLPHAQEMRIQCGGIRGLQILVDESEEVADIHKMLEAAQQKFGELEDFPYSQIIRLAKEHYKGR